MTIVEDRIQAHLDAARLHEYGHFLDGLDVGLLAHGPDGELRYLNDAARSMLGREGPALGLDNSWGLRDVAGRHVPLSELPPMQALRDGCPTRGAVYLCEDGGERRWLRIDAQPLQGRSGELLSVLTGVRDVTEKM